jgi:hypothetical protein
VDELEVHREAREEVKTNGLRRSSPVLLHGDQFRPGVNGLTLAQRAVVDFTGADSLLTAGTLNFVGEASSPGRAESSGRKHPTHFLHCLMRLPTREKENARRAARRPRRFRLDAFAILPLAPQAAGTTGPTSAS